MRSIAMMASVALLAVLSSSCDTTQPMQADVQLLELSVDAASLPAVTLFNVYDGTSDCDGDGMPDDDDMDGEPDVFLHCRTRSPQMPGSPPPSASPNGFPWQFTIEISIVRENASGPAMITSEAARASVLLSLTPSDSRTNFQLSGGVPPLAPINFQGCTYTFSNGRARTAVFKDVLAATYNPLAIGDPGNYGTKGTGLCSTNDPGPPRVDALTGTDYPFVIALGKGETVIVQSVRADAAPMGVTGFTGPGPNIRANLRLNDDLLGVRGTTDAAPGGSFSFTYTSR